MRFVDGQPMQIELGLNRLSEAERDMSRAIAINESVLGSDHPDTNRVRVDIATLDSA